MEQSQFVAVSWSAVFFKLFFFFMFKGSKFVDNVSKLLINIRMNFGLRAGSPRVLGWGLKENPYLYIIWGA